MYKVSQSRMCLLLRKRTLCDKKKSNEIMVAPEEHSEEGSRKVSREAQDVRHVKRKMRTDI